jgi:hypothetical protein
MEGFTQRYKSIVKAIFFTLEITKDILLEAFRILIEFTVVYKNNEHLPYLNDALSSQIGRDFV